jgi:flavin-dependent dehydrogenase
MERFDGVVVVGGGPAGAATALRLARASIPVTVIERTKFPRRKVCGEYLGAGTVAALDALGLADAVRAEAVALRGVRLVSQAGHRLELEFSRPTLSLPRERLDALIMGQACRAGAAVVNARVEDLIFERDGGRVGGVVVRDPDGERRPVAARFVVGADGMGSLVARKLGVARPIPRRARFAVGGHYRGIGPLDGCVEMYAAGDAYFAVNPLGGDLANVMVVAPKEALRIWSRVIDFTAAIRVGARVSIGPLAHGTTRAVAPGAILVGDAAGFLNPFTGQGIHLALRGAERAANALAASYALRGGETPAFAAYDRERAAEFHARERLAGLVDLLVRVPALGRRAARRLERCADLRALMADALAGFVPAADALRPSVVRRLLL